MNAPEVGFSRMLAVSSVIAECDRQGDRSDIPDGTGKGTQPLLKLAPSSWNGYSPSAIRVWQDAARVIDRLGDRVKWSDVLLEAVFKAAAEDDVAELRRALVKVAAVSVRWVEALDLREVDA